MLTTITTHTTATHLQIHIYFMSPVLFIPYLCYAFFNSANFYLLVYYALLWIPLSYLHAKRNRLYFKL